MAQAPRYNGNTLNKSCGYLYLGPCRILKLEAAFKTFKALKVFPVQISALSLVSLRS